MADNINVTPGSGSTVAGDDIGGVVHQRVKIEVGADGTANDVTPVTADAAAATSLIPVQNLVFNGTVWDRARGHNAADSDADGTGLPGVGINIVDPNVGGVNRIWGSHADGMSHKRILPSSLMLFNGTTWDRVRGDTTNGLDVDVTRVQGTVTVDTELPAGAALADTAANPTTVSVGAHSLVFNGTDWDRVRGDITNGVDVDVTRVQGTVTVDTELPAGAALADATANPTTVSVGSHPHQYNGTTWDREQNKVEGVALAAASRTINTASSELSNLNRSGVVVLINYSTPPASGDVKVQIRGRIGGNTYVILESAALTVAGVYAFEVFPGVGAAANGVSARVSGVIPRLWDINIVHSTANATTYEVRYSLV